jgi:hypothetical protein
VGSGRFFTAGRMYERTAWAELHTDGAGSISIPLECFLSGHTVMVREHLVTLSLMSGLRFLGRHAAERAGAVGTAAVSARILPDVLAYDTAEPAVRRAIQHQLSTGHAPADEYSPRAQVELLGRADWWDAPEANLHFAAQQKINDARGQLRRQAIPNTPEEIVNELPFGFWVGLLGSGNRYDQRFWRTTLHRAFPHYRGRRRVLHQQLDYLRVLRNKIAHHSPIHHRHLQADHETIVEVLGYIDRGLADLVRRYSPVDAVLNRRPPTP